MIGIMIDVFTIGIVIIAAIVLCNIWLNPPKQYRWPEPVIDTALISVKPKQPRFRRCYIGEMQVDFESLKPGDKVLLVDDVRKVKWLMLVTSEVFPAQGEGNYGVQADIIEMSAEAGAGEMQ